jgi:hypothetical protein
MDFCFVVDGFARGFASCEKTMLVALRSARSWPEASRKFTLIPLGVLPLAVFVMILRRSAPAFAFIKIHRSKFAKDIKAWRSAAQPLQSGR